LVKILINNYFLINFHHYQLYINNEIQYLDIVVLNMLKYIHKHHQNDDYVMHNLNIISILDIKMNNFT
jgi:hypothetical protein